MRHSIHNDLTFLVCFAFSVLHFSVLLDPFQMIRLCRKLGGLPEGWTRSSTPLGPGPTAFSTKIGHRQFSETTDILNQSPIYAFSRNDTPSRTDLTRPTIRGDIVHFGEHFLALVWHMV